MSLSSNPVPQRDNKPAHLPVSPIRPVPALEKKPGASATPAATRPEDKPLTTAELKAETPQAPQSAAAQPVEKKPAPAAAAPEKQATAPAKRRWLDALLDTALTLMVAGVIGGGSYYIKTQRDLYRIPSVIEETNQQCLELYQQLESLQDAANHADEQLHMRRKLAALNDKLRDFSEEIALRQAAINEQQKRVLALQHEIRRADKEARTVARGLMPGLYVGDVSTTRGKTYTETTISRLDGREISLRTPYGAASLPTSELVRDGLPDIVLYALGMMDIVNTKDFTANGSVPGGYKPAAPASHPSKPAAQDYEPTPTGPVVDTSTNTAD